MKFNRITVHGLKIDWYYHTGIPAVSNQWGGLMFQNIIPYVKVFLFYICKFEWAIKKHNFQDDVSGLTTIKVPTKHFIGPFYYTWWYKCGIPVEKLSDLVVRKCSIIYYGPPSIIVTWQSAPMFVGWQTRHCNARRPSVMYTVPLLVYLW